MKRLPRQLTKTKIQKNQSKITFITSTIQPFTAFGREMTEMHVRGRNGEITNYNEIKYCTFCGSKLIRFEDYSKLSQLISMPFSALSLL
jgi:hypothetical protein